MQLRTSDAITHYYTNLWIPASRKMVETKRQSLKNAARNPRNDARHDRIEKLAKVTQQSAHLLQHYAKDTFKKSFRLVQHALSPEGIGLLARRAAADSAKPKTTKGNKGHKGSKGGKGKNGKGGGKRSYEDSIDDFSFNFS